MRKQLASLNRDSVQAYFNGIDKILNELDETKSNLEVSFYYSFHLLSQLFKAEEQIRLEFLVEAKELCTTLRKDLNQMRKNVISVMKSYNSNKSGILERIEKVRNQTKS